MQRTGILLIFLLIMRGTLVGAQPGVPSAGFIDLRHEWLIHQGSRYSQYEGQKVNAVYFNIDGSLHRKDLLYLRSDKPYTVWVNQMLIMTVEQGTTWLNIDSLSNLYSPLLAIGIFQKEGIQSLTTHIFMPSHAQPPDTDPGVRPGNFFLNFSLLAVLFLSIYFVALLRTNPRLTLDYVNISKLLSIQEREENLMATRVTSSVNLLFYLFCSAFCALVLLAVFNTGKDSVGISQHFVIRSTPEGFYQWIKLSAIIAGWLTLKLLIIYIFSNLFNMRDTSAIQFFNFIRMLFFIIGLMAGVCIIYFIYYGYPVAPHAILLKVSLLIMAFSVIMIFLKLLTLARFSFFHLFSYLCASEIIPLVILLKVLLY